MNQYSSNHITKEELKEVEEFADQLFEELGIDIAFTNHFYERLNDPRNGKQITEEELKEMFQDTFLKIGDNLLDMKINTEAVIEPLLAKSEKLSITPSPLLSQLGGSAKTKLERRNIIFMEFS